MCKEFLTELRFLHRIIIGACVAYVGIGICMSDSYSMLRLVEVVTESLSPEKLRDCTIRKIINDTANSEREGPCACPEDRREELAALQSLAPTNRILHMNVYDVSRLGIEEAGQYVSFLGISMNLLYIAFVGPILLGILLLQFLFMLVHARDHMSEEARTFPWAPIMGRRHLLYKAVAIVGPVAVSMGYPITLAKYGLAWHYVIGPICDVFLSFAALYHVQLLHDAIDASVCNAGTTEASRNTTASQ